MNIFLETTTIKIRGQVSSLGENNGEQEIEEIVFGLKFIIVRNILIKFHYTLIWLPILSFIV